MANQPASTEFLNAAENAVRNGTCVAIALRGYRGAEAALKSIDIRSIMVKREAKLSVTYHYKTRDIVKNYSYAECMEYLYGWLREFTSATLKTTAGDMTLERHANGNVKLARRAASQIHAPDPEHNRAKKRLVATQNKPYLRTLGITDANGNVLAAAQDKYRQIDKYVEILDGLIEALPPATLHRIVDMGAGKGYLTFALYDHLTHTRGRNVEMVGVEARADLVALCNRIAVESDFTRLRFEQGTIAAFDCSNANVVIALHACDTATDDALFKAITAGADLIVTAPCCHKQIRREMEKSNVVNAVSFMTRHGSMLERQAEMVTDGLRAELLEYSGYRTKIFEFISDAHTPKNRMIVATKTRITPAQAAKRLQTIHETKTYFGITTHPLAHALGLEKNA